MNSIVNSFFTHGFSKSGLAFGCETRSGHSGAPVISANAEPEVLGIHKGKTVNPKNWLEYIGTYNNLEFLQTQKLFPEHSEFNNISCVPLPFDKKISPLCSHTVNALPEKKPKTHDAQMSEQIANWLQEIQVDFQFNLAKKDKKRALRLIAVPSCFNPAKNWKVEANLSRSRKYSASDMWYQFDVQSLMLFRKVPGLDHRFRLQGEVLRNKKKRRKFYVQEAADGDLNVVVFHPKKGTKTFKVPPCDTDKVDFADRETDKDVDTEASDVETEVSETTE